MIARIEGTLVDIVDGVAEVRAGGMPGDGLVYEGSPRCRRRRPPN